MVFLWCSWTFVYILRFSQYFEGILIKVGQTRNPKTLYPKTKNKFNESDPLFYGFFNETFLISATRNEYISYWRQQISLFQVNIANDWNICQCRCCHTFHEHEAWFSISLSLNFMSRIPNFTLLDIFLKDF